MNKLALIDLINSINLLKEDFVVLSSGALVLRGILENANDLDIAVTVNGLNKLKENYDLILKTNGFYKVNDCVECVLSDMVGRKELIDDYYVQEIHDYLSYLKQSSREKDKLRIPLVEQYIKKGD